MRILFLLFAGLLVLAPMGVYADYSDGLHQFVRGQYSQAFNEFKPLAEEGNPEAQYILGSMYAQGKGVLQDYVQAHAWFNIAASQGHEKAALYRDEIAQKMTSSQVAKAQQLASQLQSQAGKPEEKSTDQNLNVSIQQHLQELGYYSGAIDGLMGPNTRGSIRQFQRDANLQVTGEPSHSLLEKLEEAVARQTGQKDVSQAPQGPWTTVLLQDEFTDGDFKTDPGWTAVSGDFWVDASYFLRTQRAVPRSTQSGEQGSAEKRVADIFGKVVKEILSPQQGAQAADLSELYTQRQAGNAFALEVTMKVLSKQAGQNFELRMYHDPDRSSGYLLKLLTDKEQSLALIRFDQSGSSVIDMHRQERLLQTNKLHKVSWMRYADGRMKVLVGNTKVLNTQDNMFKKFDGFSIVNGGGDYAVGSIRILGSQS